MESAHIQSRLVETLLFSHSREKQDQVSASFLDPGAQFRDPFLGKSKPITYSAWFKSSLPVINGIDHLPGALSSTSELAYPPPQTRSQGSQPHVAPSNVQALACDATS